MKFKVGDRVIVQHDGHPLMGRMVPNGTLGTITKSSENDFYNLDCCTLFRYQGKVLRLVVSVSKKLKLLQAIKDFK